MLFRSSVKQLGRAIHGEKADERAPREANEKDLPFAERAAEIPREGDGFADELIGVHRRERNVGSKRFSRSTLIPMHDDEVALQPGIGVGERHLRQARSAMEKEQHGPGPISTADKDPPG